MWRCFYDTLGLHGSSDIFSTYVEVFLSRILVVAGWLYFLHVCGGVSEWFRDENLQDSFSPRMWRCFLFSALVTAGEAIFSTYVEVFLTTYQKNKSGAHFLHVCGGVSLSTIQTISRKQFSPRMWRCFFVMQSSFEALLIFSTYVEVFLTRQNAQSLFQNFLHVRGGVSF